jgi:hypothetical protein
MAIPFIIGAIIAAKAVSTAADIYSDRKQARMFEREGEMERELFGKNAEVAEEMAEDAIARGKEAELRFLFKQRTLAGAQQASFSGQGVRVGVGTPGLVTESDASLIDSDIALTRENAQREAFGYRQQAEIYQSQGALAYQAGRNRAKALRNQTLGSLANFGGDMFSLYQGYKGSKGGK